jgi:hypothetical protein
MSNAPQNQKSAPTSNQSSASKAGAIPLKDEQKPQEATKDKAGSTSGAASDSKSSSGAK